MKLYPLAIVAGALPILTIYFCYWLAASTGHVPACIPYFQSCTSISSSGRVGVEFYIFKGLMIPAACLILVFWYYCCEWLNLLGSSQLGLRRFIIGLGAIACLGLILYSLMLGAIGPEYRVQRRIGVITFFTMSFFAQMLFTVALVKLRQYKTRFRTERRILLFALLIIVLFAVSAVVISSIDSKVYDTVEDAFEWWVTSILSFFPLLVGVLWRKTEFKTNFSVRA